MFDKKYSGLLLRALPFIDSQLRNGAGNLHYYGTGEAGHWPVQSNFNAAGALALLGALPDIPDEQREKCQRTALSLFRYGMATHKTGSLTASCGKQWGGSWITVLGLERAVAGQIELEKLFTAADHEAFRKLRIFEADWLLNELPVVAHMDNSTRMNKPESNCWNGSFLYRMAIDFPELPQADAYRKKAIEFLLNSISHPLDAASETLYENQPLRLWHRGFNFTPNYSLDHHGYMNIGYSVITLSHVAYLHFYCKLRNVPVPEAAYLHVRDLWEVLRNFIFPDGRLLRCGGDNRARYCYCQAYLLPVLLLMADLGYPEAASLEAGLLNILETEQLANPDGSFYGSRLHELSAQSRYYYTRLESDPFAALSAAAYLRSKFAFPASPESPVTLPDVQWHDDFHAANLIRTATTARSIVRKAFNGPIALAAVLDDSSLTEWQGNGFTAFVTHRTRFTSTCGRQQDFPGGFVNTGENFWCDFWPIGEGEENYPVIRSRSVCVGIDDGKSMVILEHSQVIKECALRSYRTAAWKVPNDVYNRYTRTFRGENFQRTLQCREGAGVIDTSSKWVNVDDKLTLILGYGAESWQIHAPEKPIISIDGGYAGGPAGPYTLYANEVCMQAFFDPHTRHLPGEVLADTAYAVVANVSAAESPAYSLETLSREGWLRKVKFRTPSGAEYLITVNFGDDPITLDGKTLPPLTSFHEKRSKTRKANLVTFFPERK